MKQELLEHPRNFNVLFDEDRHLYYVNGELYNGITSLVGDFFDAFDKDKVAKRVGYIKGVNPEALKAEWESDTDYGKNIHKAIENLVNFAEYDEKYQFALDSFVATMNFYDINPLVAEMTIYSDELKRASNVDIIGERDGKLVIIDTKTMKKTITREAFKDKRCFFPISHLNQSKFNKHSLQVNFYRRWLIDFYGFDVSEENYVFNFNENREHPIDMIAIPPMDNEINLITEYKKQFVK